MITMSKVAWLPNLLGPKEGVAEIVAEVQLGEQGWESGGLVDGHGGSAGGSNCLT